MDSSSYFHTLKLNSDAASVVLAYIAEPTNEGLRLRAYVALYSILISGFLKPLGAAVTGLCRFIFFVEPPAFFSELKSPSRHQPSADISAQAAGILKLLPGGNKDALTMGLHLIHTCRHLFADPQVLAVVGSKLSCTAKAVCISAFSAKNLENDAVLALWLAETGLKAVVTSDRDQVLHVRRIAGQPDPVVIRMLARGKCCVLTGSLYSRENGAKFLSQFTRSTTQQLALYEKLSDSSLPPLDRSKVTSQLNELRIASFGSLFMCAASILDRRIPGAGHGCCVILRSDHTLNLGHTSTWLATRGITPLLALLQTYKLTGHSDELIHLVQQSGLGDKVSDFAASNCDVLQRMCLFFGRIQREPRVHHAWLGRIFCACFKQDCRSS